MTGRVSGQDRSTGAKLAWFAGIWAASVLTLAVVGGLLKWFLAS